MHAHTHILILIFMSFVILHLKFPSSLSFKFQIGQKYKSLLCILLIIASFLDVMCVSAALCSVADVGGLVV